MKMAKHLVLSIVCACSAALGQATSSAALEDYTLKLRLTPGLVINCPVFGGHTPEGHLLGDYEDRSSITGNSTQGLSFDWSMTQPANAAGHREVRNEDMRQSHKVSVYYMNGENGARAGYSDIVRVSDVIYSELKQGKKTAFEFDGNENPQSIQLVGTEYLTALVNERKVRIRTLKGKTANGWYFWVLDNPVFPMLVKGDASWHWTVPSFTYPETSTKSLLEQLRTKGVATTHAVLFAFNSAELSGESKPTLNAVADYLKANPAMRIQVEGYTDNIGGGPFNLQLSRSRAESVKQYLTHAGINSGRLTSAGFGMGNPVAGNATPEDRALNRRVVFREERTSPAGGK